MAYRSFFRSVPENRRRRAESSLTAERQKAIGRAIKLMEKGLPLGDALRRFARDEMHAR
jgi:hypothetical protein